MQESPFFLVWCPTRGSPTVRQPDFETAEAEAKRLARQCPGEEFFVTAAVSRVMKVDVGVTRFTIPQPKPPCPTCKLSPAECDCVPF